MAQELKVFPFATTAEGWVFTSLDSATGIYSSGDAALEIDNAGRNAKDVTSYWEWSGTFEDLGVPSGSTITGYSSSALDYKCTVFNTVTTLTSGPYTINDGTLRTLVAGASITATDTVFTTASQGAAVTGLSLASTTSVTLRVACDSDCGNNASAQSTILLDDITVGIDYTGGAGAADTLLATLQDPGRSIGPDRANRLGGELQ